MCDIAPLRNRLYKDKLRSHIWFGGKVASRDQHIPSTNWRSNNYIGGIAYIYGLPIDGPLVSKRTFSFSNAVVPKVCQEFLIMAQRLRKDVNDTNIKFKWLEDNLKISKKKNEIYKIRAYLFIFVARQFFSNSSGMRGPAPLLKLFRDIDTIS